MSLSDLIAHDEHRRSTMTRAKYLARIGKIRSFEKLNAAQVVADRYADDEATFLINQRRNWVRTVGEDAPARSRQRDVVRVERTRRLGLDWDGYEAAQQQERNGVRTSDGRLVKVVIGPEEKKVDEPAIRQIRFRKKGGE